MTKKIKIAYGVAIAITAGACVYDIIIARYIGAGVLALTAVWLMICYKYGNLLSEYERMLKESLTREKISVQELAKMRKRAQEAERKYKELFNDTPARGAKGRYEKRK
jgi:uncharacterized oligopeptide transporter (OPT) family protein